MHMENLTDKQMKLDKEIKHTVVYTGPWCDRTLCAFAYLLFV